METPKNQSEEKLFYLSKDAMFALSIDGLIGFFYDDNKALWKNLTEFRLKILMPDTINDIEDYQRLLFILVLAQVVGLIEIETEVLQKIRGCVDEEEFQLTYKIDFGKPELNDDNIKIITETVIRLGVDAGFNNPEAAFTELDTLNVELKIDEMNLSEVPK